MAVPEVAQVLPLSDLRHERVIVVMAPSGVGKSYALKDEHELLTGARSCLVDLKDLQVAGDPVAVLSARTQVPASFSAAEWHVLLDSFDEAVTQLPSTTLVLREWLKQWAAPEKRALLRLRVTTRPGGQGNDALIALLEAFWGQDAVPVRDMTLLTRDDALKAGATAGVTSPEGFVEELERRGLAAVASVPVTLMDMAERSARGLGLPTSAREAYRQACNRLCEEAPGRNRPAGLPLAQLERSAERLAAALQFCADGVLITHREAYQQDGVRLRDIADHS
jgi:hypothetical protein